MMKVMSKAFSDISYNDRERILTVIFNDGAVVDYLDLPQAVFEELQAASSMGSYFNKEIRPNYRSISRRGQK